LAQIGHVDNVWRLVLSIYGLRVIKNLLRPRSVLLVVALVLAALLASCSSASVRAPAPPPTRSLVSRSPSPSPAPRVDEKAAVIAAVRDFYAAVDLSLRTGQTANIIKTSTADCTCREMAGFVQSMFRKGRVVEGGVTVGSLEVVGVTPTVAVVDLTYDYPAFHVLDAHGHDITGSQRERGRSSVELRPVPAGWLVEHVYNVASR
jgi:hypothetical protein